MFFELLYKQVSGLVVTFSALIRLIGLCLFRNKSFSSQGMYFKNLPFEFTTNWRDDQVNRGSIFFSLCGKEVFWSRKLSHTQTEHKVRVAQYHALSYPTV